MQAEEALKQLEDHDGSEFPVETVITVIGLLPQILALIKKGSKAQRLDAHDKLIQLLSERISKLEQFGVGAEQHFASILNKK